MSKKIKRDLNCKLCDFKAIGQGSLIRHLRKEHSIIYEDYVIKHILNGKRPECKCGCGTEMTKFCPNEPNFYNDYTTNHFPRKPHTEETKTKIKATFKKVMMEKYGVENPMELQYFKDKIADTKEKNFGDRNYNNMPKNKATKLKNHGDENYCNSDKRDETNIKKFGSKGPMFDPEVQKKSKATKLERHGNAKYQNMPAVAETKQRKYGYTSEFADPEWRRTHNINFSRIEPLICKALNAQSKFIFMGKEYDMLLNGKYIIEVDGDWYHPDSFNDLSIIQLQNLTNDFIKTRNVFLYGKQYELIRIKASKIKGYNVDNVNLEFVLNNQRKQDFSVEYKQVIVTKEYFLNFIQKSGKKKLEKYLNTFYKFIEYLQPDFPEIPTDEILEDLNKKIRNYDLSKIKINETDFNQNSSNLGVSYLKSNFRSYWKSSYNGNKSPIESWKDIAFMKKMIAYRIGINESNEIFDFTIHQMIRGISAYRRTISFFKPILASAIYKEFLGDKKDPIVLDPCAGFGGRLLGFKALYPDGKYIGIEPNIETFTELQKLAGNFTNIELYNCKIEDFLLKEVVDLTFTSIPYYDREIYSNVVEYKDLDQWKEEFIGKIKLLPKLLVNIPEDLRNLFENVSKEYKILSNTSHFNKKVNQKYEYLLKTF